jgi:hypothetical protein
MGRKIMGAIVFNNVSFDSWLNNKSDEILLKGQSQGISNEEMLILILKANTTHFHHMDVESRQEFRKIDQRFEKLESQVDKLQGKMDARFKDMEVKIDTRFRDMEVKMDDKFQKIWSFQKWQAGMLIALFGGLYLKLFLG